MREAIPAEIEALFRRESRRLISVLTRILGPGNLEIAEDVMQEAFMAAMDDWVRQGVPENPAGWLFTAARNRAVDAIRRERTRRTFAADLTMYLDSEWTLARTVDEAFSEDWIKDDQLRMIFMCCHPRLPVDSRVTLILKTLCGLSVPAIARALLTTESTINKRLYRTRQLLRDVRFELPPEAELPAALDTVHTALYLLFNEGYLSTGEKPILRELCRDAMLLARLVVDESSLANSQTVALLALMCFSAARFDARIDEDGRLVPLDQQDRSRWDRSLIRQGYDYLARSSTMEAVAATRFHLEAAIAARHCEAETFDQTDWPSICQPVRTPARDRSVADGRIEPRGGDCHFAMARKRRFRSSRPCVRLDRLPHSHVVAAVLANLYARAGSEEPARRFLDEALSRARTPHERDLIALQFERARR